MKSSLRSHCAVAGLEWCTSLAAEIEARLDEVPLLEIIPENFFPAPGNTVPARLAREIERRGLPVMLHSISFSLCSVEPLKEGHLAQVIDVLRQFPTTIGVSDHLCLTEKDGAAIGQLTPAPYTAETLDCVSRKILAITEATERPFALENIAHPFMVPGQEIRETDFINRVLDRTGARLLLDLHNIYTNAINFAIDPYDWLSQIDLARVDSIHLAGGYYDDEHFMQDGHCARVPEPVWALYAHVIRAARRPIPTIVERTGRNGAGLQPVLEDQWKAQRIMDAELAEPRRAVTS